MPPIRTISLSNIEIFRAKRKSFHSVDTLLFRIETYLYISFEKRVKKETNRIVHFARIESLKTRGGEGRREWFSCEKIRIPKGIELKRRSFDISLLYIFSFFYASSSFSSVGFVVVDSRREREGNSGRGAKREYIRIRCWGEKERGEKEGKRGKRGERGGTRHGDKRCVVCRWRSGTFGYARGRSAVDRANTAAPQPPLAEVSARRCAGAGRRRGSKPLHHGICIIIITSVMPSWADTASYSYKYI